MMKVGYGEAAPYPAEELRLLDMHRQKCRRCVKSGEFPPEKGYLCVVGKTYLQAYLEAKERFDKQHGMEAGHAGE